MKRQLKICALVVVCVCVGGGGLCFENSMVTMVNNKSHRNEILMVTGLIHEAVCFGPFFLGFSLEKERV